MVSLLSKMHRMSSKAMSLTNKAKTTAFRSMCAIYRNQKGRECLATAVKAVTWRSMCKTSQDYHQPQPQQRHRHQSCLHLQAMSPLISGRATKQGREMTNKTFMTLRLWVRKMVHSRLSRLDSATSTTWMKLYLLYRLHQGGTVWTLFRSMKWTRITIAVQATYWIKIRLTLLKWGIKCPTPMRQRVIQVELDTSKKARARKMTKLSLQSSLRGPKPPLTRSWSATRLPKKIKSKAHPRHPRRKKRYSAPKRTSKKREKCHLNNSSKLESTSSNETWVKVHLARSNLASVCEPRKK